MIHITTEIGKPGKKERERKHFSAHNQPGDFPEFKPRGRRYIPHNNGRQPDWRPHNQNIDVQYSEAGPDWSSRLKYIPHPENTDYPAAEIWENNWKSMRPYPFTYQLSRKEWLLDPGLTKVGLRCSFDGVHKASLTSDNEITHTMLFGKGRREKFIDKRNSIDEAAPGDNSYQVPEYSPSFYGKARSRNFGTNGTSPRGVIKTFIPVTLQPLALKESFQKKAGKKLKLDEIEEVKNLDVWQPAKDISTTIPVLDPAEYKRY